MSIGVNQLQTPHSNSDILKSFLSLNQDNLGTQVLRLSPHRCLSVFPQFPVTWTISRHLWNFSMAAEQDLEWLFNSSVLLSSLKGD